MTKSLHFAHEQWTQRVSITVKIVTYFTVIYLCCVIRILWKYNMYLTAPFRFRRDSIVLASLNRNYPFPIVVFYFRGVVDEVNVPVIAVSYISWIIFSCDQAALQMVFSVCLSVCLSVRPSVRLSHLFDYVPIIVSSWNFQELLPVTEVTSMQKVKVRGQRSRSQRSQPNFTVSGL